MNSSFHEQSTRQLVFTSSGISRTGPAFLYFPQGGRNFTHRCCESSASCTGVCNSEDSRAILIDQLGCFAETLRADRWVNRLGCLCHSNFSESLRYLFRLLLLANCFRDAEGYICIYRRHDRRCSCRAVGPSGLATYAITRGGYVLQSRSTYITSDKFTPRIYRFSPFVVFI